MAKRGSGDGYCKRVTIMLPESVVAELERVVPERGRSRFLSYCARLELARMSGDTGGVIHWKAALKALLKG